MDLTVVDKKNSLSVWKFFLNGGVRR